MQVIDQISKLFVSGTDIFREHIFAIVQRHTGKFKDAKSFEEYYLLLASHNIKERNDLFRIESEAFNLYEQLFKMSYSFKSLT
jgi:hypothetical protein